MNDYPFLLVNFDDETAAMLGAYGLVIDLNGSSGVSIAIRGNLITKIDAKYLPKAGVSNLVNGSLPGAFRSTLAVAESDEYTMGSASVSLGTFTKAEGDIAFAAGDSVYASSYAQFVHGKFNIENTADRYAHIVGNGEDDDNRSNAYTLDWDGNAWFAGSVEGTSLILSSSTPNSTKRFRITVDDNGTLSAVSITSRT